LCHRLDFGYEAGGGRDGPIAAGAPFAKVNGNMKRALLCLTMLWAATAAAGEPAAGTDLATLFPENVSRALVVALGTANARQLEQQVGDLLHDSGRVGRVVPSSVLGTMTGLGEAALTTRALKLPIDAVVVVRSDGDPVLVAVYRDGTRRGPTPLVLARSAVPRATTPPEPRPAPPSDSAAPASPAPAPAAAPAPVATPAPHPAVAPAPVAAPPPRRTAEEARNYYEEKYIGFRETKSVTRNQPYEGRYQRLLLWPEFYNKVGRPDLEERSVGRRAWGRGLVATGIILGVASVLSFTIQSYVNTCSSLSSCSVSANGYIAAGVFGGASLIVTLTGSLLPTRVVPAWEARRLADSYNQRLRAELGINP
jgi:hypothetical protein